MELPVEEERVSKALFQEAEARDDAGPAPAFVSNLKDIDLEDVAGLCAGDGDGASESVDEAAVDVLELVDRHGGVDLCAAGVLTFKVDGVARRDSEARRERGVPAGVGGGGSEGVGHKRAIRDKR